MEVCLGVIQSGELLVATGGKVCMSHRAAPGSLYATYGMPRVRNMERLDDHSSWFRVRIMDLCALIALILVPAIPGAHRYKCQSICGKLTHWVRMYAVSVVNKITQKEFGLRAISSGAPSVVSILAIWGIPRFKTQRRKGAHNLRSYLRGDSPSQMGQDALALLLSGSGQSKFFVEAGACDGYFSSNTWLLETQHHWSGILCEPGRVWHEKLLSTRNCKIDTRVIWSTSGETLKFRETELPNLSTVEGFTEADMHAASRRRGLTYEVMSVSLVGLLVENESPDYIDFLSLDTEGTEFEILSKFPFERYEFGLIACEHNNTTSKIAIQELLTRNGYEYLDELASISLGDAWFVGPRLQPRLAELRLGLV